MTGSDIDQVDEAIRFDERSKENEDRARLAKMRMDKVKRIDPLYFAISIGLGTLMTILLSFYSIAFGLFSIAFVIIVGAVLALPAGLFLIGRFDHVYLASFCFGFTLTVFFGGMIFYKIAKDKGYSFA